MWNKLVTENMSDPFADIIGCGDGHDSDAYMLDDSMHDIFLVVFRYPIAEQD